MKRPFEVRARLRSFKYAFRGIFSLVASQHNAWIHAFATVIVVVFGIYFHVSTSDWCWLVMAMTMVWMAEALNTAVEFVADAAITDIHPLIEKAKDIAAAAVLITAI